MKEFWIYTAMRGLIFVACLGVVTGVWMLVSDQVPLLWVIVISFALSGVASYFLLARQREAFAQRVQTRADRASASLEASRSKEDVD